MAGKLDKLSKDDLFLWLSEMIDEDTASAVKDNGLSGANLLELTDDELKEVVSKLGPRKEIKRLLETFKREGTAQPKVCSTTECMQMSCSCK